MNLVMIICYVSYKTTIGRLKVLRTEIEHLQLLLERAKVKLQKDFQKWWSQEASSVQVTDHTLTTYLLYETTPHKVSGSMK